MFVYQYASTDMQNDLFRSSPDLDLMSNFDLDLSMSNSLSLEATKREKNDGAIADCVSLLVQTLFVKTIFAPNSYSRNI